ncbi:MAG TPA: hypothetical protein VK528_12005 [Flavobacterium sp.]|nr:hypothetical protein [Flavobacterium sp.]
MPESETIFQYLKPNFKRHEIKDLGINPDKPWLKIELGELSELASALEILVSDLVDF